MNPIRTMVAGLVLLAVSVPLRAERTKVLERRTTVAATQAVELRGLRGSEIEFKTWNEPAVRVELRISVSSSDDEWEERYLNAAGLDVDSTKERVTITYREPDDKQFSGSWIKRLFNFRWYRKTNVSGVVYIPRKNAFTTDLKYGSLTLEGVQGEVRLLGQSNTINVRDCPFLAEIKNDYGQVTVERSGGSLQLECKSGSVTVEDFHGALVVDAPYSTVQIVRLDKGLTLESKSATISVAEIGGDVKIDADYSRVTVDRVAGMVDIVDKSGTVRVRSVDGVNIDAAYSDVAVNDVSGKRGTPIIVRGQSGRLALTRATGDVRIDNSYSTMELTDIKGNVDVRAQSASIDAAGIVGDWNSETSYTDVRVKDLKAQNVLVSNSSNEVSLELASAPSTLKVRNSYGGVEISVPRSLSAKVRLKAEFGTIKTDLPIDVDTMGSGELATGTVNAGTGTFTVETKSGNIRIRQH